MKKILALLLVGALALPASAQVFRSGVMHGAALGAVAGAVIGNNSGGHNGAKGALVGAAAGAVLSGAPAEVRVGGAWGHGPRPGPDFGPRIVRAPHGHHPRGGDWGPDLWWTVPVLYSAYDYGYSYDDYGYDYTYAEPSGTWGGMLLGGIAGAIIGNNSGHGNGGRGALIGAATGAVLGSIHDANYARSRRVVRTPRYYEPVERTTSAATTQTAPQQVTIINNYYTTTPMSAANSLFGRN